MAQIAVTIIEPGDRRSAHLVENLRPIRDLLPPILTALKLPQEVNYQLFTVASDRPLRTEASLADAGVPAGAELQLRPVQNRILKAILDQLYKQALNYAKKQMWKEAKEKLETLLRLDPTYPDPLGLEQAIETHSPPASGIEAAARPTTAPRAVPTQTVPEPVQGKFRLEPQQAVKSTGSSCLRIVVLIGFLAAAGATIAFLVITGLLPIPPLTPTPTPGISQEERDDGIQLGTGDVQITLRWDEPTDLDLHVIDPAQEEIWFNAKTARSGGELDVDANAGCDNQLPLPVENVFWPTGEAPRGSYKVSVVYYTECEDSGPTDYEVTIKVDGEIVDVIRGQLTTQDNAHTVATFNY